MTGTGRRLLLIRLVAACLAACAAWPAVAQSPTRPRPRLLSALASQTPAPPEARPYEDRVLETGPQPDLGEQEGKGYDDSGWARNLRLDFSLGASRGPSRSTIRALAFSGYVETPHHGTASLQGNLIHSTSEADQVFGIPATDVRFGTWRIDQRAMPLQGGWLADHSAGDINTLVPSLGRGLTRVFLPSAPMSGLGGRWLKDDRQELNASAGRPGLFTGLDVSGFERRRGALVTAGGQVRVLDERPSRIDAAAQVVQAQDAQDMGIPAGSQATAAWASIAWEGQAPWGTGLRRTNSADPVHTRPGGARLQASLLQSGGVDGNANGAWIDGGWRTQLVQHTAGLFRFEPGLRWGVMTMPADLRGAYWRGAVAMRQWQLGWSGELSSSVTGAAADSRYANVYGRYVVSLRNALDVSLAVRSGNGPAQSLQANWDHRSDWGQTRWRSSFLRSRGFHTTFLGVDHTWAMSAPTLLATALGWQATSDPAVNSPIVTWALLATTSPLAGLSLDASLHGAQGGNTRSLLANVGLNWQFARDWAAALRYTESRGQDPQSVEVISALTAATQMPLAPRIASRSVQVNLRYEVRAGTLPVPLGGSRTSGAGGLSGTVFLDTDHNGRREAGEQGVPNVTVVLDGRFVTRTDATGRYEFPSVAAGDHVLQVQPDNIPLPWSPARQDLVRTAVVVRGNTVEDFPLQRER